MYLMKYSINYKAMFIKGARQERIKKQNYYGICTAMPESKIINLADLNLPETKINILL